MSKLLTPYHPPLTQNPVLYLPDGRRHVVRKRDPFVEVLTLEEEMRKDMVAEEKSHDPLA